MKGKKTNSSRNEDPIFVEVYEPVTLRKDILSGAVECIDILKNFELSRSLRETKRRQEREVISIISNLKKEYKMLKDSMPKAETKNKLDIKDPFAQYQKKAKEEQKKEHKEKAEKYPVGLAKLEKELEYIKSKLGSI